MPTLCGSCGHRAVATAPARSGRELRGRELRGRELRGRALHSPLGSGPVYHVTGPSLDAPINRKGADVQR